MFGSSKGCRRETGVEEIGRRAKRGMCELSICMNPPLLRPTPTCSATSNSYHRAEEPLITYTGAEHRGRVLMWYRSEDGHKNERQPAKRSSKIDGWTARRLRKSYESSESSSRCVGYFLQAAFYCMHYFYFATSYCSADLKYYM